MKKTILFLLCLLQLAMISRAQQRAPYPRTQTNQVLSDYGTWSRYFMGIPKGPVPGFPSWVPDSVKCGALYANTTDHRLYYYDCYSASWHKVADSAVTNSYIKASIDSVLSANTYQTTSNLQTTLDSSATHYPSTSAVSAALNTFDLVICLGQSNIQGQGNYLQAPASVPGNYYYLNGALHVANNPIYGYQKASAYHGDMMTSWANTYFQLTGRHVIMINLAKSSTALLHQDDGGAGHWDWTDGSLTTDAIARIKTMQDSLNIMHVKINKIMFIWGQGEQDAVYIYTGSVTANMYRDTLISVAKRLRAAVGSPQAHFYIWRTGPHNVPPNPDYNIAVRNAQESVPAKDSLSFVVARNNIEFPALGLMSPTQPNVHYSQAGYNIWGSQGAIDMVQHLSRTSYTLGSMIFWDGARMGQSPTIQYDTVYKAIRLGGANIGGFAAISTALDTLSNTSVGKNASAVYAHYGNNLPPLIALLASRGTSITNAYPIQAGDTISNFEAFSNYGTGSAAYNPLPAISITGIATESRSNYSHSGSGIQFAVTKNGTSVPFNAGYFDNSGGFYATNTPLGGVTYPTRLYSRAIVTDSSSMTVDGLSNLPALVLRNATYTTSNRLNITMNANSNVRIDAIRPLYINYDNNQPIFLGSGTLTKAGFTYGVVHSGAGGTLSTNLISSADLQGSLSLTGTVTISKISPATTFQAAPGGLHDSLRFANSQHMVEKALNNGLFLNWTQTDTTVTANVDTSSATGLATKPYVNNFLTKANAGATYAPIHGDNYSTSATPSISAGAGMGAGGGTILISGTNQDGVITFTTGTSPAASSIIITITLSGSPYPNSAIPVITPGGSTGSLAGCNMVGVGVNTNSWSINSGTTPLAANTTYTFYYHCGGY